MRRSILCLTFYLSILSVHAQITKGTWLAGGNGKFETYTSNWIADAVNYSQQSRYTDINVSPAIGYFIADHFALGLRPAWESTKGGEISPRGGTTNLKSIWVGPFVRYYLLNDEKPFNIISDFTYQAGWYSNSPQKGNLNSISLSAGPVIFFNSSIGLEVLLGYNSTNEDHGTYKTKKHGFQLSAGFQFHLEPFN